MEIKLRAWHKSAKEMIYFDNEKWPKDKYQANHLGELMNGDHPHGEISFSLGQRDSNGDLIYTGDKCEIKKSIWPSGQEYVETLVISEPNFLELEEKHGGGQDWYETIESVYVVGHKWEAEK